MEGICQSFLFYVLKWDLRAQFPLCQTFVSNIQQKYLSSYVVKFFTNTLHKAVLNASSEHCLDLITFGVRCSCLEKSPFLNNRFNKLLTNDLYNIVWPESQVYLCHYMPHSTRSQMLPCSPYVRAPYAILNSNPKINTQSAENNRT